MKTFSKALFASAAFIGFSTVSAQAGEINLGGVVVPTAETGRADGSIFVDLPNLDASNGLDNSDFVDGAIFGRVEDIGAVDDDPSLTWLNLDNDVELTYTLDIDVLGAEGSLDNTGSGFINIEIAASLNYFIDDTPDFQGEANFIEANADGSEIGQTHFLSAETADSAFLTLAFQNGVLSFINQGVAEIAFNVTGGDFADNFNTSPGGSPLLNDIVTFSVSASRQPSGLLEGSTDTQFFAIPEPASLGLLGMGLLGLGAVRRRRKA